MRRAPVVRFPFRARTRQHWFEPRTFATGNALHLQLQCVVCVSVCSLVQVARASRSFDDREGGRAIKILVSAVRDNSHVIYLSGEKITAVVLSASSRHKHSQINGVGLAAHCTFDAQRDPTFLILRSLLLLFLLLLPLLLLLLPLGRVFYYFYYARGHCSPYPLYYQEARSFFQTRPRPYLAAFARSAVAAEWLHLAASRTIQ